jgi:hypothetical protein
MSLHRTVLGLVFLALFGLLVPDASAQRDAGSFVGSVRDSSGAVVPSATVTIRDVATHATFTTVTNSVGEYVSGPLKIGRYTLTVSSAGFQSAELGPFELAVQQRREVNVTLALGGVGEQVVVKAEAPILDTQSTELGQVVSRREIESLPLNGRNFAQLALLASGVGPSEPGARNELSYGFSSNGARSLQNNFLLDGVDNNSNLTDLLNGANYVIQPSIDALEEFKVQTNDYSAEFGRGNGAILNATIKSGTNDFRGNVFDFLRNEAFDSKNFFDETKSPYRQNQFGGTFGGPIVKDRTFFFVDYEGLRLNRGETLLAQVPTAAWRSGNFQDLIDYTTPILGGNGAPVLDCNGKPTYAGELFNSRLTRSSPQSPTGLCGVPFGYGPNGLPLNVIPAGLIDPLAARLLGLYPLPNSNTPGFNYLGEPLSNATRNGFDVRVDHKVSERNSAFVRFSYGQQHRLSPSPFEATGGDGGDFFSGIEDNVGESVAASDTHIFRPNLVNEFRFGYNHLHSSRYQFNYNVNLSAQYGFPGVPGGALNGGLPNLTFSDVTNLGSPQFLPSDEKQNTFSYMDNLTWIAGRHTLKFGTEIRDETFTIFQPATPKGTMDFGPQFTDNPAAPSTGGGGFASFLLGVPDGGSINNLENVQYKRQSYSAFVQDDFRPSERLTLNLGLRYEYYTPVTEQNNQQGNFDLNSLTLFVPQGVTAQLTPTIASLIKLSPTAPAGLIPSDALDFAPRLGVNFKASSHIDLSAGYGIFYGGAENGPYSNPSPAFNPPFLVTQVFATPCSASAANPGDTDCSIPGLSHLSQGFPSDSLIDPNTPFLDVIDPHLKTPLMQQWHLSSEFELPLSTSLEISYAGSRGSRLYTFYPSANQAAPTTDPTIALAPRRPQPALGDTSVTLLRTDGTSRYNALQVHIEHRSDDGFSYLLSYTWSHSLDTASNASLPSQNNGAFRWTAHPEWEYGNSDFDVRHRLVFSYVLPLPFGHGRHFGREAKGVLGALISDWTLSGITTISSGNWFTITDIQSQSNSDSASPRPDQVGNPNAAPCVAGTVFNTCAFAHSGPGSFGNTGRNTVLGPGLQTWDATLFRRIPISDRRRFELRIDAFNLLNRNNLLLAPSGAEVGINSTTLGEPQFGFPAASRPPRQVQVSLKFFF